MPPNLTKSFATGGSASPLARTWPVSVPHPCATPGSRQHGPPQCARGHQARVATQGPWQHTHVPSAHRQPSSSRTQACMGARHLWNLHWSPRWTVSLHTSPGRSLTPLATAPDRDPNGQSPCGPPLPTARLGNPCPLEVPPWGSDGTCGPPAPPNPSPTVTHPLSQPPCGKSRAPRHQRSRARETWGPAVQG